MTLLLILIGVMVVHRAPNSRHANDNSALPKPDLNPRRWRELKLRWLVVMQVIRSLHHPQTNTKHHRPGLTPLRPTVLAVRLRYARNIGRPTPGGSDKAMPNLGPNGLPTGSRWAEFPGVGVSTSKGAVHTMRKHLKSVPHRRVARTPSTQ